MRIVFMGTPAFAIPSLMVINSEKRWELAAVVTNPDEPQGRGLKSVPPPVKVAADQLGLKVIQATNLNDPAFHSLLEDLSPDLLVVVAFKILPAKVLSVPKLASFNLHASLLPKYRGAAPVNWAIANGEKETGVTTFLLEEGVDKGKILVQKKTVIGEDETAGELLEKLSHLGAQAVVETIELIENGNYIAIPQDESKASRAPKIKKQDCLLEWSKPAEALHNFIRAFSPDPGAYTFFRGKMLKIYRTRKTNIPSAFAPGQLITMGNELYVSTADKLLMIVELQLEGRKKLPASEFIRGARLQPAEKFEKPAR
ncbi:MAG: methionyl-tRNA formyltransferase [Candidatus Kryptoniota bacterium]